ncbi:hypothetical protein L6452_01104 [Arctium lappa]|uniref:Uncharacterized protein n=1 Tax=Arctium lappa TaxID=4217 RepID=A0ACB9FG69_ARCLA|nr:hypothetical protein L6452_01104 [Arctium lappa]
MEADLWNLIDAKANQSNDFLSCLFAIIDDCSTLNLNKFLLMLWSIWNRRNDALWNNTLKLTTHVKRKAMEVLNDWQLATELRMQHEHGQRADRCLLWHKPPNDFMKCKHQCCRDS